jgi:hypothetical protein
MRWETEGRRGGGTEMKRRVKRDRKSEGSTVLVPMDNPMLM